MGNQASGGWRASGALVLLLGGCGGGKPALVPIAASAPPSVLAPPDRAVSRSIPFTDLWIRSTATTPKQIVPDLFFTTDIRRIPGPTGELSAIELSNCASAVSVHVESLDKDSCEVARLGDRAKAMKWVAAGSALSGEKPAVRLVSVTVARMHEPSRFLGLEWGGDPFQKVKFTVQSMLLAQDSPIESARDFTDLETLVNPCILAVGDCNSDGQDDFLLVMLRGEECQLLSGNALQPLATIPTRKLGLVATSVGDVDGDGGEDVFVSEDTGTDFCIISPRTSKVLRRVTFDAALGTKIFARKACNTGKSAQG